MKTLWLGPAVILLADCTMGGWVQEDKSDFNSRREYFDFENVIVMKHGGLQRVESFTAAMEINKCMQVKRYPRRKI